MAGGRQTGRAPTRPGEIPPLSRPGLLLPLLQRGRLAGRPAQPVVGTNAEVRAQWAPRRYLLALLKGVGVAAASVTAPTPIHRVVALAGRVPRSQAAEALHRPAFQHLHANGGPSHGDGSRVRHLLGRGHGQARPERPQRKLGPPDLAPLNIVRRAASYPSEDFSGSLWFDGGVDSAKPNLRQSLGPRDHNSPRHQDPAKECGQVVRPRWCLFPVKLEHHTACPRVPHTKGTGQAVTRR